MARPRHSATRLGLGRTTLVLLALLCVPAAARADRATAQGLLRDGNDDYFQGSWEAAEAHYGSAIGADDTWAVPYSNRGLARLHRGDFAGAEADFEAAKTRDTAAIAPFINKGKCLAAQKKFTEAVTELQAGLDKAPTNAKLRFNLAWVYDEQERWADAISQYNAALEADPTYLRAVVGKGVSLARNGDAANASAALFGAINAARSGDMLASIAAYDLLVLRGRTLSFTNGAAQTDWKAGLFAMGAGLWDQAAALLSSARASEAALPDIPWLLTFCHLRRQDRAAATSALVDATALLPAIEVRSWEPSTVHVDGIPRGTTPAVIRLFPGPQALTLRGSASGSMLERTLMVYGGVTPPGARAVLAQPAIKTTMPPFGPVVDSDSDWLADDWEARYLFGLGASGAEDPDADGLSNARESWLGTDPRKADSDGDGVKDGDELRAGSDPAGGTTLGSLALTSEPNRYLVASSGHTAGSGSTMWLSDAVLHNAGGESASARLFFLKKGQDNSDTPSIPVVIPAGQSVKLGDLVKTTFGEAGTSGAVLVGSSLPLIVTSRTFNTAATGTYGQYIEGYPLGQAIGTGKTVRLIALTKNASFRTNLGIASATSKRIEVRAELFRADGSALGSAAYTVEPFGYLQVNDVIATFGKTADDAYAVVSSSTPGAAYFAYASVIDARTGDPVQVVPVGQDEEPATTAGLEGGLHSGPADIAFADPVTALTSGVPVQDSVAEGAYEHYSITVPADPVRLEVRTTNSQADIDLFLRFGAQVDASTNDYAALTGSGDETITVTPTSTPRPLQPGTWYIAVKGYRASPYTLTATVTTNSSCTLTCSATVPPSGSVGSALTFQGVATPTGCGLASTFEWDFGDGSSHGTVQNPTHIYASSGSYTWQLTVHNGTVTCSQTGTITVAGVPIYLPAAAHLGGSAGTNWRTDPEIHNPGPASATFTIELLKRDQPNPSPASRSFSLDPGRSIRYPDVLDQVFGFSGSATLRVRPSQGKVMVTGRTYNDVSTGTFGQFIPGVSGTRGFAAGETARLVQLAQSADASRGFRTNLGLVNISAVPATITVTLSRGDGTVVGTKSYPLGAFEFKQIDRIFSSVTTQGVDDGFAVLTTASAGAAFLAYASVIDNRSGDPIYIPAARPEEANADPCLATIRLGASSEGEWTTECPSVHREGRYAKYYSFTLTSSTTVRIDLESSVDDYLVLLAGRGRDGNVLGSDDDSGDGANARIIKALEPGTYTIEAVPYAASRTGTFTLRLAVDGS
ncbi:MAG TPA: pre-peptidase C-terminal domain-containing protein [Thermoanaerobaculaceae bacterium]|nr:pre-peptidase C-terminal domain-containing protein [Thermoanaerobaculaceae bacterium]